MEAGIARSFGTCMTMGTASTMTSLAEALGHDAARRVVDPGRRLRPSAAWRPPAAGASSTMIWEDLKPRDILSRASFENALVAQMALGGSTNAIIHLIAMAGRAGIDLTLADFDRVAREVPVLANIRPSGAFLMEDFYYAGGLPALLGELKRQARPLGADRHRRDARRGHRRRQGATTPTSSARSTIRSRRRSAPRCCTGNLAPDGCVIKPSAAEPRLLKHAGPALVFRDYNEMAARIDSDDLEVTPDHVLVLQNAGPIGGPGMPEWGMLPIPKKLLKQGVRDMLRISDARMSGTSYGACILHVAPESYVGGPLAAVRTGDIIAVDVDRRSINLEVTDGRDRSGG